MCLNETSEARLCVGREDCAEQKDFIDVTKDLRQNLSGLVEHQASFQSKATGSVPENKKCQPSHKQSE